MTSTTEVTIKHSTQNVFGATETMLAETMLADLCSGPL